MDKGAQSPHSCLWPTVRFHVSVSKEMPRNDEELAGPEGWGGKTSVAMLPDKLAPNS